MKRLLIGLMFATAMIVPLSLAGPVQAQLFQNEAGAYQNYMQSKALNPYGQAGGPLWEQEVAAFKEWQRIKNDNDRAINPAVNPYANPYLQVNPRFGWRNLPRFW